MCCHLVLLKWSRIKTGLDKQQYTTFLGQVDINKSRLNFSVCRRGISVFLANKTKREKEIKCITTVCTRHRKVVSGQPFCFPLPLPGLVGVHVCVRGVGGGATLWSGLRSKRKTRVSRYSVTQKPPFFHSPTITNTHMGKTDPFMNTCRQIGLVT